MAAGGSTVWTRLLQRPSRALGFLLGLRLVLSLIGLREPTLWLDEASSLYVAVGGTSGGADRGLGGGAPEEAGGPGSGVRTLAVGGPTAPPRLLDRLALAENSP